MKAFDRIFPSTAPAAPSAAPPDAVTATSLDSADRACPECGSPAAADQGGCLEGGSRIERPHSKWRQPVAIMASVALIFVAAMALALSEVAKDASIAKAKTVKRYVAAPPPPAATTPPAPEAPTPSSSDKPPKTSSNPTDTSTPDSGSGSGSGDRAN